MCSVVCVCGVCEGRGYNVEEGCVQMNRSLYVRRGLHTLAIGASGNVYVHACVCVYVHLRVHECV